MLSSSSLEPLVILYQANQPADLQLWNGNFFPIFLFGINKFLSGDAKNIVCFLLKIAIFIKQQPLDNMTAKNIP